MSLKPIEYRTKTEPPKAPGWYYGRSSHPDALPRNKIIRPWFVETIGANGDVFLASGQNVSGLVDWFGPVTEVKEG